MVYNLQISDANFTIQDIVMATPLAVAIGCSRAAKILAPERPPKTAFNPRGSLHTGGQVLVAVAFQGITIAFIKGIKGYQKYRAPRGSLPAAASTLESSALILMALMELVGVSLILNKGRPHRQPLYMNRYLMLTVMMQAGFILLCLFSYNRITGGFMGLVSYESVFSTKYRSIFLSLLIAYIVCAVGAQQAISAVLRCSRFTKS